MDIIQILADIEGVKKSLDTIAQNGIPIIDTFAPITTMVNIVTTVFSTAFGGWITLQLFKRQEKIRIREQKKLDFYDEYERLYKIVLEYFDIYIKNIEEVSQYFNPDKLQSTIDGIVDKKDVDYTFKIMDDGIGIVSNIKSSLEKIENFMNSKKTITGYDKYKYDSIKKEIEKYDEYFKELNSKHSDICPDKMLVESGKRLGLEMELYMDEDITAYKEVLGNILEKNNKFELLLKNMQDINGEIEQEFIGKYFEQKNNKFNFK